jgi:hypothetical protein
MVKIKLVAQNLLALLAIISIFSCNSSLDIVDQALPEGSKKIVITTANSNLSVLLGYQISITAPDGSTTELSPEGTSATIENITSGTYILTASKSGFISRVKEMEISVPSDKSSTFLRQVRLFLTEQNPLTKIDHVKGGTIEVPAVGNNGIGPGSKLTKIVVPPGALEGTGVTSIGVTVVPIDPEDLIDGAMPYIFQFEPHGLVFAKPITIEIPLDLPTQMLEGGVSPELIYIGTPTETIPMKVSSDGLTVSAQISHFSSYQYRINSTLHTVRWPQDIIEIIFNADDCGLNVLVEYITTDPRLLPTNLANLGWFGTENVGFNISETRINTDQEFYLKSTLTIPIYALTLEVTSTGQVIETFDYSNGGSYTISDELVPCHISGFSD